MNIVWTKISQWSELPIRQICPKIKHKFCQKQNEITIKSEISTNCTQKNKQSKQQPINFSKILKSRPLSTRAFVLLNSFFKLLDKLNVIWLLMCFLFKRVLCTVQRNVGMMKMMCSVLSCVCNVCNRLEIELNVLGILHFRFCLRCVWVMEWLR